MSLLASLMPHIFFILESFISVSKDMLTPVLLGTLYNIIGISTLDAINLKCSYRPIWVVLL